MAGINQICGLAFLLITIILYLTLQKVQEVFNSNRALAQFARYECTEASMEEVVGVDSISGKCYSVLVDFEIRGKACSNNILTDSICDKCISLEQNVRQWQHWTVEVCKNARNMRSEEYDVENLTPEERKNYEELARKKNCHTEDRYGWRNKEGNGISWQFPSSDPIDHGRRGFFNDINNLRLQDMDSTDDTHSAIFGGSAFDEKKMTLAYTIAMLKTGNTPVSIYNGTLYTGANNAYESQRDQHQLCIQHTEANEFIGGITTSEFENLPDFGELDEYPLCDDENKSVGTYSVEAECRGQPDAGVRVIGNIHKDDVTGKTHFGPFTHPSYADIDKFPVSMFVWEQDHTLSHDDAITNYITDISKLFKAFKNGMNTAIIFCLLICIGCLKGKGGSSSSSS